MFSIYKKEISSFFNSLIAYMVMSVFLVFTGLFTWVFKDTSILEYGYADMSALFTFGPLAFLLLIPAITMRTFSDEKKDGTIELLLTKPVTEWQIIWGKYFSSLTLVIFALLPTVVYYISIYGLGAPAGNIDTAAVVSSYVGLILLGSVYVSVGIFSSSIFSNQIVSFIVALVLCYCLMDGLSYLAQLDLFGSGAVVSRLSLNYHYDALSKGVIDSRNVMYFAGIIALMLTATRLKLESRQW